MPDNKAKTAPLDASRINVNESYEVDYWTSKYNCSRSELEKAVAAVGTSASKVEEYLKQNK